ncbi:hypothetical protein K2173_013395 [Erythroxylum novogranatense]|uniref:S-adenosyl-L-methionine-dependent methyltransferase superfamily protein n=1 Tax=Erythroxylum novogranatense TaxID=1862640 RepID=A0AAV8S9R5_9ROSI|nr:hypothetical protein K2173_013395 [Erythroxylum novogranatense]
MSSSTTTTTTTVPTTATSSLSSPVTTSNYLTNLGLGYSIATALGFLVLLSTVLLASYIYCRARNRRNNDNGDSSQNSPSDGIILPSIIFVAEEDEELGGRVNDDSVAVGLDQAVINSYPNQTYHACYPWLPFQAIIFELELSLKKMRKPNISVKIGNWGGCIHRPIYMLGVLVLVISIATLTRLYSIRSIFSSDTFCKNEFIDGQGGVISEEHIGIRTITDKIERELSEIRDLRVDSSAAAYMSRYSVFLAEVLVMIKSLQTNLPEEARQEKDGIRFVHPLMTPNESANFFLIEEIRKYVRVKPNRLGKQNFMGANGTFTSIGHACFDMKKELEEYMDYDVGEICNDDWKLAQRLMVHGCDPLPRRRCLSRAPKLYNKPLPINESMWKLPDDRNVRWSHYRCKTFTCLASNSTRKGFFKCADCFNLSDHEMPRWIKHVDLNTTITNVTTDFLIPEILGIKPGEVRIGLDFSVGTGTFAARMREFNVTIVSATINLGAPFSEMIALRGLVPLYLTINQRLPFFDNTLDLIHTTRFLDGWIDLVLLDFILYDWDRVLRPGGLLWIDSFFCLKEDLDDYLEAFKMLRYKKHKWVIAPKLDKDDREAFFSAVLEKPPRPFR